MIGKTNCKAAQQQPCEFVNITIQSDSSPFSGATFTVSYGDYSKTYTWDGSTMTVEIPAYVEYTVSFGDVDKFTTPASVTNTAQSGNSRTVDVTYTLAVEKLTVKVSGITSGYTVSVVNATTGATIGTQTTASKTYSIPAGTKYRVQGSSVGGYITPSISSTYTAVIGGTRTVTMTYVAHSGTMTPGYGVYIWDTDHYFHTEDGWDGTYTANGVAVITHNCQFIIALEDAAYTQCEWGSYGTTVSGITTTTDSSVAKTDRNGEAQTTKILSELGNSSSIDDAPAAYYCQAYTFPCGAKGGYLGAAGEWQVAADNKAAITSALSKCGGTAMNDCYWTSTQCNSNNSWYMSWEYEELISDNKGYGNYVRAFSYWFNL